MTLEEHLATEGRAKVVHLRYPMKIGLFADLWITDRLKGTVKKTVLARGIEEGLEAYRVRLD